jgi:hypothetical protein
VYRYVNPEVDVWNVPVADIDPDPKSPYSATDVFPFIVSGNPTPVVIPVPVKFVYPVPAVNVIVEFVD